MTRSSTWPRFFDSILISLLYTSLFIGLASAQTTVTLTSSVEQAGRQVVCPREEVTFTCTVTEAGELEWRINQSGPIRFVLSDIPDIIGASQMDPSGRFTAVLTSGGMRNGLFGDFTSQLTVTVSEMLNGTVVQCSDGSSISMNKTLNIAVPPSLPQQSSYSVSQYSLNSFTVAVQWESPASDGGVGIDNYTLTGTGITVPITVLSNQPLMAPLTLSYNEMHMVSITASNCAGESTATVVTIHEVGCGLPTPPPRGSLGDLNSSQEGAVVAFQCDPGLVPSQQMMSVCAANGNWTPDPAVLIICVQPPPGDCGVPASPTDGTVAYTTTTAGSLATFQCSAGLVPVALMTAVCKESGGVARWSPDPGDLSCVDVPLPCHGTLGSLSCDDVADGTCYTASYAVQPDDSVTFTVSARTPANTWVGLGVSDDQRMANSDIVLGAANGTDSFTHDRFASAQAEPPIDASQDIESAPAERVDGVTTITFNRPRNSSDSNDTSLGECRFFLFAYNGTTNVFFMPPIIIWHGDGPTRRAASIERICIPTFTECSAGDCGVPASPSNGTVAYTTTTVGSQVTFQCSAGLVPGEVMTAVCENSGGGARWSPDPGDLSCATPADSSDPAVVIPVVVVVVIVVSVAVVATVIIAYLCWRKRSSGAFVVKTEAAADVSNDYARVTGRGVEMDSLAKDANGFYDQPDTQKPAAERLENATDGFYSYADTRRLPPPQAPESILREAAPGTSELYTVPETKKGSKKKKEATPAEYSEVDMKKKHQPPSGDKAGEASAEEYSQLQRQKAPKGVIDLSDPTYSHFQTGSRAVRTSLEETSPLPARLEPEGVAPPHPPKSPLSGPPRPARRSRRQTPERNIEMPSRPPKPTPYRGDQ